MVGLGLVKGWLKKNLLCEEEKILNFSAHTAPKLENSSPYPNYVGYGQEFLSMGAVWDEKFRELFFTLIRFFFIHPLIRLSLTYVLSAKPLQLLEDHPKGNFPKSARLVRTWGKWLKIVKCQILEKTNSVQFSHLSWQLFLQKNIELSYSVTPPPIVSSDMAQQRYVTVDIWTLT